LHCQDIYSLDETEEKTVQKPNRAVAMTGMKPVEAVTSADKVCLVTMAVAVSSNGNSISMFFVFRPINYRNYFTARGLDDMLYLSTNQGVMSVDNVVFYMEHSIKHIKVTKEKPVLILLYNYQPHLHITFLDLAKENGVVMPFQPHTSLTMRPQTGQFMGLLRSL
jgi:hypothetical protein